MYKFGEALLDLEAVVAIIRTNSLGSITVIFSGTQIYLTAEFCENDEPGTSYYDMCDKRYDELVEAWEKAKGCWDCIYER